MKSQTIEELTYQPPNKPTILNQPLNEGRFAVFCRYCGASLSFDAIFCERCGKQITQNVDKETTLKEKTEYVVPERFCPYCKAKIYVESSKICPHCGKSTTFN